MLVAGSFDALLEESVDEYDDEGETCVYFVFL